ncbi:hypothetical protein F5Y17DRAFT_373599 [Xylariaceae sp. FL0594]|nr:hypothetical protein F5Y17DRAFT_373599 [Xylariaceae sp. FL0594]
MRRISGELQGATGVFTLKSSGSGDDDDGGAILDMCAAPGAFLEVAVEMNPQAVQIKGFTLPVAEGGHAVLADQERVRDAIREVDINFLAEDMGMRLEDIPDTHPDKARFLPSAFGVGGGANKSSEEKGDDVDKENRDISQVEEEKELYDLILCDGQVLRTHPRADYRERREAQRLGLAQLAIGLSHIRPGGKMLVLMHKVESWKCVIILYTLSKFADIELYKPRGGHAKRGSFYLVAKNVRPESSEAVTAVEGWKKLWRLATFGDPGSERGRGDEGEDRKKNAGGEDEEEGEGDEFSRLAREMAPDANDLLNEFGETLIELGRPIWRTQADALRKTPFVRDAVETAGASV